MASCPRVFARVRVRAAQGNRARAPEWLLIEWPAAETAPTHYWLSTLPENLPFKQLVAHAKGCWRIERDYQELKSELGLSHYEGRNWRGFHHHATLCIAANGFLILERLAGKKTPLDSRRLPYPNASARAGLAPPGSVRCPGRSPPCASVSRAPSLKRCHSALVAEGGKVDEHDLFNTVELRTLIKMSQCSPLLPSSSPFSPRERG
jgi:hypothetical protein